MLKVVVGVSAAIPVTLAGVGSGIVSSVEAPDEGSVLVDVVHGDCR